MYSNPALLNILANSVSVLSKEVCKYPRVFVALALVRGVSIFSPLTSNFLAETLPFSNVTTSSE